jgi:hypothetical protein
MYIEIKYIEKFILERRKVVKNIVLDYNTGNLNRTKSYVRLLNYHINTRCDGIRYVVTFKICYAKPAVNFNWRNGELPWESEIENVGLLLLQNNFPPNN